MMVFNSRVVLVFMLQMAKISGPSIIIFLTNISENAYYACFSVEVGSGEK